MCNSGYDGGDSQGEAWRNWEKEGGANHGNFGNKFSWHLNELTEGIVLV